MEITLSLYSSFSYDGNLKRVKQVVNGQTIYSVYDPSGALLTRDNASTSEKTDYLTIAGQTFVRIKNGTASYPLNDHLGTAFAVATQGGSIPGNQSFNTTPFGEAWGANAPTDEQGFTGHVEDATGLTHMQARYYDPVIGRFLSPDPVGYQAQLNQHAYVQNDPVNRIDPNGETDIYIGGVGDQNSKIVQSYAAAQTGVGSRSVGYFSHGDKAGVVAFATKNSGNGEPLNIIGHSYGATTAVKATKDLAAAGIGVDNLVGVDGVRKAFQRGGLGDAESSVGNVIGINSTGSGSNGDLVEGLGKALGWLTAGGRNTKCIHKGECGCIHFGRR